MAVSEKPLTSRNNFKLNDMKNLFNLTLSAVIALFLITSCDKKETAQIKPKAEKEITVEQIKNSKNPYDKEGEIHNKFLDYFIAKTNGKNDMNREKVYVIYESFHKESKIEFGDEERKSFGPLMDALSELSIGGPYIDLNICKRFPALCNLTGTGPYNPSETLAPTDGTTSTERTVAYIKQLAELEAKVLNNEVLKDDQKKDLLSYYAVARYSSAYWHNVANIQKSKSGWYDSFSEANAVAPCHTCDVVQADANGSTVAGGIGAAIASAAVVIEKTWSWW